MNDLQNKIEIIKNKLLCLYNIKVINVSLKDTFIIFKIKHLTNKKISFYSINKYEFLSVPIDYLIDDILTEKEGI